MKWFYMGYADGLYYLGDSKRDDNNERIPCGIETPDWDGGAPDIDKTFLRFGLKIDTVLDTNLVFVVQMSLNRGATWKSAGSLTIVAGNNEAFLSLLETGSTVRFKLSSRSDVMPYTIEEITVRVVGRGIEIDVGD